MNQDLTLHAPSSIGVIKNPSASAARVYPARDGLVLKLMYWMSTKSLGGDREHISTGDLPRTFVESSRDRSGSCAGRALAQTGLRTEL